MSQSSNQTEPTSKQSFWMQWILVNSLGHGIGLALPILFADLFSVQDYKSYGVVAYLSFGIWVGLPQWLVLRQIIPISSLWIWVVVLSPLLSLLLILPVALSLAPLVFVIYPLLLSCGQWLVLRQRLQKTSAWIVNNAIFVTMSGLVGGVFGVARILPNYLGISILLGGLCGGFVYGLMSGMELRRLIRQSPQLLSNQRQSNFDTPPNFSVWRFQIFSFLLLAVLFGVWLQVIWSISPTSRLIPIWLGLIVYAYSFLSILVHELGHLLFALSNGFELKYFAVGRWILVRQDKGFKLRRMRRRVAGGFVLPVSKSLESLDRRLCMMTLGGPVGSFLLFFVGALPVLLFPKLVSDNDTIRCIVFISVLSLHAAILNAIPLKFGYWNTDGRIMLNLIQNNSQGQRFAALYGVSASLRQGIRPRDIDPDLVRRVLAIPDKSVEHISGLLIGYYVALDRGEYEQAAHYLDQALDMHLYYPELFRASLLIEGTYFEAHIRHRVDYARQWFEKIQETVLVEPYTLLRAEAALLLAQGDKASARLKAEQGLANIQRDRSVLQGAIAENDWLHSLLQKAT